MTPGGPTFSKAGTTLTTSYKAGTFLRERNDSRGEETTYGEGEEVELDGQEVNRLRETENSSAGLQEKATTSAIT